MRVRVLSVPAGHVYVRHLAPPDGDDSVVRLADPPVAGDVPAAQWWPPPALDATWVREHADDFDLAHLHFGFDARSPQQLRDWVTELQARGKPLVYTVHDLRNPHHEDPGAHDEHLDVLVPAADALVTLTPGAASVIERRWGRLARVLPHPHVVEEPDLCRPRPERGAFVAGVHLKSLRASIDPLPVVETLAKAVADLPGARLRVDVHADVVTEGYPRHDREVAWRLRALADAGPVDLHVHDFFSDAELWDYLISLDVSVLPYRFGTHSGWLEACHDLGTTVLVGDVGFYAEQRPCLTYPVGPGGPDHAALEAGLRRAYDERPRWRADPEERRAERVALATAHRDLYAGLLGR
ncbi:MAG: glycosyltransferase family 1 protein [Nocardioidaceae bacterium]